MKVIPPFLLMRSRQPCFYTEWRLLINTITENCLMKKNFLILSLIVLTSALTWTCSTDSNDPMVPLNGRNIWAGPSVTIILL